MEVSPIEMIGKDKAHDIVRQHGLAKCKRAYDLDSTGLYDFQAISDVLFVTRLEAMELVGAWRCLKEPW